MEMKFEIMNNSCTFEYVNFKPTEFGRFMNESSLNT